MTSRRDFLKWMTLGAAALAARPLASRLDLGRDASAPNVFIFVFDAWCADHLSIHGYPRDTMPNLARFAERSFVYHNHSSVGSFTVPGVASLLTGLYPWSHRAIQLSAGGVHPAHRDHSIFHAFTKSHATFGYGQNPYADVILSQFENGLDSRLVESHFNRESFMVSSLPVFKKDRRIAFASLEYNIFRNNMSGGMGSLYLGMTSRLAGISNTIQTRRAHREYPAGTPTSSGAFLLDELANGVRDTIRNFAPPTLAYFHVYPPHDPYAPRREFMKLFHDSWVPAEKPVHPVLPTRHAADETLINRLRYDQYLAAWDYEFGRIMGQLEASGHLNNSVIVLTSDHGELFERGEIGHNTFLLTNPVTHVPLLISLPGQTKRVDVRAFTSSVDILPTLANLVGLEIPAWSEGRLLPGLGGEEDLNRSIYSMDAKTASSFAAIEKCSMSLTRQLHRLVYYNYPHYSGFEFYNLHDDPQELTDLFPTKPSLALDMQSELLQTIADFNRPYNKLNDTNHLASQLS